MLIEYKTLDFGDVALLQELNFLFGEAFEDPERYHHSPPNKLYLENLLKKDNFICLVALENGKVLGGLVAYVLEKFEMEQKEIYIYDLAVAELYRRKGIARNLILELKRIASDKNAYVIYVQADYGDDPAIKLYESLGIREEVLHFDIAVDQKNQ
ncbi:AAC(3)-I family aminoglycoside N-acetyltransferase [Leptospira sp. GIMC2001]|uniref:AAC(3)-I family aminoglycoside N-acetyltransferase n=1 Tax=Leptospira sp. GIMC2001 TaxID=1513297 RepID=UPI002348F2D9|nr:AAC(3)-I family aminoglycoside N-acetyltransferase [Leptospira sp. GIMC2001]WCL50447.1 AAC(3)-I family aminoglycoside N-acetyltransferase [Leptospira sp. GIMC2001]